METKHYSKIEWSDFRSESHAPIERKKQYIDIELSELQCKDESICVDRPVQQADI